MSGPCWLTGDDPVMTAYHHEEWGRPVIDERGLYERMSLEGFQSGLSWRTVLNKRPAFREVYANFEPEAVAEFGPDDVDRLLLDARIIRHRRKIEAVVNNAQALLKLHDSGGTLVGLFWEHAADALGPPPAVLSDLPATTPVSSDLSKRLRKLGFAFVGPTTAYASMQACGIVNDHLTDCPFREKVEAQRVAAIKKLGLQ
jgi:DNA-3-methyladenine glycosylase I